MGSAVFGNTNSDILFRGNVFLNTEAAPTHFAENYTCGIVVTH